MCILLCLVLWGAGTAATVELSWQANTETDLAGYKIYYGSSSSGVYSIIIDVGNVTQYQISGLNIGNTYYFAVSAYDENGNESEFSTEVSYHVKDVDPPAVSSVSCALVDKVIVQFNEKVEKVSAEVISNYSINNGISIQSAHLQTDEKTVHLYTTTHANGTYTLTVNNVRDIALVPNSISANTQKQYSWSGNDETPPRIADFELKHDDFIVIEFSEPVETAGATNISNYVISPSVEIYSVDIAGTFSKVYVTTAPHTRGQNYTITLSNITDGSGNVSGNLQESYLCVSEDTDPPVLTAVHINTGGNEIVLDFSETLDRTSAEDESNYSISPAVSVTSAALNQDMMSVTLTTAEHAAGSYTVTAAGIGDDATPPNYLTSASLDYSYTPPDFTPPTVIGAEAPSRDLLYVTFSEPLEEASAQDVNNYSISPYLNIMRATLHVSRTKVLLETSDHTEGSYTISVRNVRDRADDPNTIAANYSVTYEYNPPDEDPPRLTAAELHGTDVLEVVFDESVARESSENTANYQISPYIEITDAVLVGDSLNRVYLSTGPHTPGVSYAVSVSNITDRAPAANMIAAGTSRSYVSPVVDNTPPRLISAKLEGQTFLVLTFSEFIDQASAENEANYQISPSLAVEEATLDASLKTVFLKTARHQPGADYTVTVTGVKDRAASPNSIGTDNTAAYHCQSVDITPPELLTAELYGNAALELRFSEPIETASAIQTANYSIDNGITIESVSISESQARVILTTSQHHQKGTYTVSVSNLRDLAESPNTIAAGASTEYVYTPVDTISPKVVSVGATNKNTIEIIFDEPLERISAENKQNYNVNNGVTVNKVILSSSLTSVYLQTTEFATGNYILTLNNIKDASANANQISNNTTVQYAYQVMDDVAPTLISAEARSSTTVLVTFSEKVDVSTAETKANYSINPGVDIRGVYLTESEKVVVLETTEHAAGQYNLTVNGIADASSSRNTIAPYTSISYDYYPPDTDKPSLVSMDMPTDSYLELTFSEPLAAAGAGIKSNYTISPQVQIINASLNANLTVVGLVTAKHAPGSYTITVSNVTDRAFTPNAIGESNSLAYTYTPPDTVAPDLISIQVKSPQSMYLTFDEELDRVSAEVIEHYAINQGIQVTNASLLASLTTVHIETSPHESGITYSMTVNGLRDRAPSPNEIASPITKTYSYDPPDTEKPELLSAKLIQGGANHLELLFSEKVDKKTAESRENYIIDPSVEVTMATLDTVTLKKVTLETTDHRPGIQYAISARNIKDRASIPNVIDAAKWVNYQMPGSGSLVDETAPQVSRVDVLSNSKIDIVFSEPVNRASVEKTSNYVINDTVSVVSAKLDTDNVRVHLETGTHDYGRSYTITVNNIRDASTYQNAMAGGSEIKYLITREATLSNVSKTAYQFATVDVGDESYVDRNYTVEQMPAYLCQQPRIVTANDDKMCETSNFVSFELFGEATIYVAFDKNIPNIPEWLRQWRQTGDQIVDSRDNVFNIYSKEASSGRVVLGGNCGTMDDNMYMVYVEPKTDSKAVISSMSKAAYDVGHISVGDTCYIDRPQTITAIPPKLEEMLWIRTANDDKMSTEPFMFHLNKKSVVYVAHDDRITQGPDWLDGWQQFDGKITNSRSDSYNIFYREFDEGDVEFGENGGTAEDNMYFVLINPVDADDDDEAGPTVPDKFELLQNYPNPFNPSTHIRTNIRFRVNDAENVSLVIYNILGQAVKNFHLSAEQLQSGVMHQVEWDGRDDNGGVVASGVYFCRIKVGHFALSRRMLLLR